MSKAEGMYRQGDVMLREKGAFDKGTVISKKNLPVVLAEGEVTGHSHDLPWGNVTMFRDDAMARSVTVKAEAPLTHQEHTTIPIPAGNYRVVRQREYDPEEARRVQD